MTLTFFSLLLGCEIYGFNSTVGALAEIWSLAAVNWDRYQAIFNPLDRDKRITKSQVFFIEEKFNIRTEHLMRRVGSQLFFLAII